LKKTRQLTLMAMLVALDVVAAYFLTIKTPFLKIGLSFIPISFTGILFRPVLGGIGAAMSDVIQYLLYPAGGYIPGITVDALLSGVVYGLLMYHKKPSLWRTLIAAAVCEIVISAGLTTFWLYLAIPGETFMALFASRIIKSIIMTPIEGVVIYAMWTFAKRVPIFGLKGDSIENRTM
jgi:ECF transporter S component (folate family)